MKGWVISGVDGQMLNGENHVTIKFSRSTLRQRNEALSALLELSNFLSSTLDLKPLLEGALAIVLNHFDLDSGRIYLLDPAEKILTLAAHMGMDISGLETMRLDEGFSGRAARTKSFIAQYISELDDKERAALLSRKGFEIIICVPLIVMDRVEGVMNLAAKKNIELAQERMDLLMTMGHQIGVAVSHMRIYRDLQQKLKEVEEKKKTIKFFAYSISHDLKSPAIGLHGLTERFYRQYGELLDDTGKVYCDHILKSAQQIVTLAEQINDYIATRELPLRLERVGGREMLALLRQEFSETLKERNITLSEPPFLPEILMDELLITRAFRNLLDNALKYGGERLSEIRIGYEQNRSHHIFSVTDNGGGIDQEEAEKLFQLFQRLEASRQIAGSGMGLAIVKEIAKKHLGDIWVESASGRGATFYLSISRKLEAMDS
jgi:signal transduction histidine kinase